MLVVGVGVDLESLNYNPPKLGDASGRACFRVKRSGELRHDCMLHLSVAFHTHLQSSILQQLTVASLHPLHFTALSD
jgi:hypothetical protein